MGSQFNVESLSRKLIFKRQNMFVHEDIIVLLLLTVTVCVIGMLNKGIDCLCHLVACWTKEFIIVCELYTQMHTHHVNNKFW